MKKSILFFMLLIPFLLHANVWGIIKTSDDEKIFLKSTPKKNAVLLTVKAKGGVCVLTYYEKNSDNRHNIMDITSETNIQLTKPGYYQLRSEDRAACGYMIHKKT